MSANKILITAFALFIGLGIMTSAGSIIGDAERHLLSYETVIEVADIEQGDPASFGGIALIYLDETNLTELQSAYLFNNFENIYNLKIHETYLIQNGSLINSSNYFWFFDGSTQDTWYISSTLPDASPVTYEFAITYNGTDYIIAIDANYETIYDIALEDYPFEITFEFETAEFTTLGRLTNVATITMTIAIISTATYFTLKGRAKA